MDAPDLQRVLDGLVEELTQARASSRLVSASRIEAALRMLRAQAACILELQRELWR